MTFWFHLQPVVAEDALQGRPGGSSGKLDCRDCLTTSAGGPGKDRFSA